VAQDVIITVEDCGTLNGVVARAMEQGGEEIIPLGERILGRVALDDVVNPATKELIVRAGEEINESAVEKIEEMDIRQMRIRSVLACEAKDGVCAMCYGRNFATGKIVGLGEAVGIIAAQSIGEPGTQLTMRTFHIGGAIQQIFKEPEIAAKGDGTIRHTGLRLVKNPQGKLVVLNKNGYVSVVNDQGRETERYNMELGAILRFADGEKVKKGQVIARWDPYNVPVHAGQSGVVDFLDIIDGVTVKKEVEGTGARGRKGGGVERLVVTEHKEDLHPQVLVKDKKTGEVVGYHSIPAGAHIVVKSGESVVAGTLLAKTPRKISKVKDITGGLPRVAELFEARKPKDAAEIAKIDGVVEFHGIEKGKRKVVVKDEASGMAESHLIPVAKHITVYEGARVSKGQQLTEGPVIPHEILEVCGPRELQDHLLNEVQAVYRLQGVEINDKHIEVIVRQMLKKVRIVEPGDTDFLYGEPVDKVKFAEVNQEVIQQGGKPAEAAPLFLGITKASLGTESFISAASFQDTTRVLTEAASTGRTDYLRGFKENVIMGHIIPAGTGFPLYRDLLLMKEGVEEEKPQVATGASE
jgi:DNA-directed RNA polymerase subunit beta'